MHGIDTRQTHPKRVEDSALRSLGTKTSILKNSSRFQAAFPCAQIHPPQNAFLCVPVLNSSMLVNKLAEFYTFFFFPKHNLDGEKPHHLTQQTGVEEGKDCHCEAFTLLGEV